MTVVRTRREKYDQSHALDDGRYWGMPTGPGQCRWCREEVDERELGWDLFYSFCVDRAACRRRASMKTIIEGRRPKSWYEALAAEVITYDKAKNKDGLERPRMKECERLGIDPHTVVDQHVEPVDAHNDGIALP